MRRLITLSVLLQLNNFYHKQECGPRVCLSVPSTHPAEGLPDAVVLLTQTGAYGDLEGLCVRVRKQTPLAAQGLLHRAREGEGEGEREGG